MLTSVFFLLFSLAGATLGVFVVYRNQARLEAVARRIGPFYEGLDTGRPRLFVTVMLFYIKRLLYAFVLLFLLDYPVIQVFLCLAITGTYTVYLIVLKPIEEPREQFLEVFNETMIFITTATVMCFTDAYEGIDSKKSAGSFACAIVFLLIMGNLAALTINIKNNLMGYVNKVRRHF